MTLRRWTLLAGLFFLSLAPIAFGRTGGEPLTERSSAMLQRMIDRARAGETIQIPAGVYMGAVVVKKDVALVGAGVRRTILDGQGADVVLDVKSGAKLSRIAVRNGKIGIQFSGPSATLQDSVVYGNTQYGVHCLANPILFNNRIHDNRIGVAVNSRGPILLHNTLARNTDAAVWSWYAPGPVMIHDLVVGSKIAIDFGAGSTPEIVRSYEWEMGKGTAGFLVEDPGFDQAIEDSLSPVEGSAVAEVVERSDLLRVKKGVTAAALYPAGYLGKRRAEVELDRSKVASFVRRYEPRVTYRLSPEPGVFQVEIAFTAPPFHLGSSKSTSRIDVIRAWDEKDQIRLHADVQTTQSGLAVKVDSFEPDAPRESGRYHLLCEYQDSETWKVAPNGKMIFQRTTSLSHVEIVPPEGWQIRRYPARQSAQGRVLRAELIPPGAADRR